MSASWIDKVMFNILNEVEEEFKEDKVSREQIKESFYLYWEIAKGFMKDTRFPRIYLPKFGYLEPRITFLTTKIKGYRRNFEKWGKDGERLAQETETAIERIRKERKKRRRK